MRSGTIQVSDGTLETGWWGPKPDDAPTLVLLHEGLGSVALWRDVPERLAASTGWGVFAYSRFGYGNSDPTPLPRPVSYMHREAQVVLPEVLRAAGIKHAVLIGHSDGGSIAAIYAACFAPPWADRKASAALSHPVGAGCLDMATGPLQNPVAESHFCLPALLGLVTIAAHFIVEDENIASIRQVSADYETGALRQRLARYHRDVDRTFWGWSDIWLDQRFRGFDLTGLLGHIQVPILGLQGTLDPYCTDQQIRVLEANVQVPCTVRFIAGARHSPHLEVKDATLSAITSFIADLPRGYPT